MRGEHPMSRCRKKPRLRRPDELSGCHHTRPGLAIGLTLMVQNWHSEARVVLVGWFVRKGRRRACRDALLPLVQARQFHRFGGHKQGLGFDGSGHDVEKLGVRER